MSAARRGSLAAQLQPRLVLTVAVMAILVVFSTIFTARTILFNQLDHDLDSAMGRQERGMASEPTGGSVPPGIKVPGMPFGTVIAIDPGSGIAYASVVGDGQVDRISDTAVRQLLDVAADGAKHNLELDSLGQYRVQARTSSIGLVTVGLPTGEIDKNIGRVTIFASGVALLATIITALITREVLSRATRPLVALTNTADEVSALALDRGLVAVPRVPASTLPESNEVTRLSAAFNQMLVNVENAFASREASETKLRRFVADASHELRNPLAAIRGYAELAQRHPEQDDAQFAMGRIESESERMSKLVNDLLLLARLDSDSHIEPTRVDAVEVVVNAVSDAQAASRDHRWLLDVPNSEMPVLADPNQLHQVMVNLLSNARTHTPAGTSVHASVHAEGDRVLIEVADDGPGISEAALPHVFERFARADSTRAHSAAQSTGLGLAIVRAIVESWGGEAEVQSKPGLTTFRIAIPMAPPPGPQLNS